MFKKNLDKGCVLVIGGAKSGKSRIAMNLALGSGMKKIFMATAQALDDEMAERIQRHIEDRGSDWITVEEPLEIADKIRELDREDRVIVLDCITLWISNLFMEYKDSTETIIERFGKLIASLTGVRGVIIIVSNEVGTGIVPENELARVYRDMAGTLNQRIALVAKKVVAVIAGIPVVIKDE